MEMGNVGYCSMSAHASCVLPVQFQDCNIPSRSLRHKCYFFPSALTLCYRQHVYQGIRSHRYVRQIVRCSREQAYDRNSQQKWTF